MPEYFQNRLSEANMLNYQMLYFVYLLCVCVSVQMLHRVVMLAAESLKVLEHQLMDGGQMQDVRVGLKKTKNTHTRKLSFTHHSIVFINGPLSQ